MRLANVSNEPQKVYSGTLATRCEPVEVIENDIIGNLKINDASRNTVGDQRFITSDDTGPFQSCDTGESRNCIPKYGRLASTSEHSEPVPSHLQELFDSSKTMLSEVEAESLSHLLTKNADAFSKYKGDIGRCSSIEHRIHTANNPSRK